MPLFRLKWMSTLKIHELLKKLLTVTTARVPDQQVGNLGNFHRINSKFRKCTKHQMLFSC